MDLCIRFFIVGAELGKILYKFWILLFYRRFAEALELSGIKSVDIFLEAISCGLSLARKDPGIRLHNVALFPSLENKRNNTGSVFDAKVPRFPASAPASRPFTESSFTQATFELTKNRNSWSSRDACMWDPYTRRVGNEWSHSERGRRRIRCVSVVKEESR